MIKIHLSLLLLLFTFFSSFAVKPIDVNPINLAVTLVEMMDSAEIVSTLKYYGFTKESGTSDFTVFKKDNDTVIQFKFSDSSQSLSYPIVEVSSKTGFKDHDKTLKNLDFHKKGNSYERIISISSKFSTNCIPIGKLGLKFYRIKLQ